MATPGPLPWPQSAQVIPIRPHKRQRAMRFTEGELTFTRWEDGEEETTLRIYCNRAHHCCEHGGCDQDHIIQISPYDAARLCTLLHEVTEQVDAPEDPVYSRHWQ